ncbi:MAG: AAA family ATPase [Escherichia coli]|nr:AAA family ATPase [Escherichia coli]
MCRISCICSSIKYDSVKTEFVYKLAHYAKFHFLSRPRRFGKSLFVSTLQG